MHQLAVPFDHYGRTIKVKMDGPEMEYLWGDFMGKLTSLGMRSGDFIRPYSFAPIDTTGSSVVLSLWRLI